MNLAEAVQAAGVVGNGGAGFPTHVKLSTSAEYFIVNAAECEPLIETDKYLCRTYPEVLVETAAHIGAALGAKHTVIALKAAYRAEIAALEAAIQSTGAAVELSLLRYFYPAGDEQTLVHQVTGRCVPERGLPSDVGCVVDNAGTVLHAANALAGKPVTHKHLSVVGEVAEPVLLYVPVGTPLTECVRAANPQIQDYGLIVGGPMMGRPLTDAEAIQKAVVTKTTGNLIVLPKHHVLFQKALLPMEAIRHRTRSACIQCRMCTDLCPRYLIGHDMRPHLIMRNLWREPSITDGGEYLAAFGEAANCCSCGVCEMFSCPMGLSPRKVNDYVKGELRARNLQSPRSTNPQARPGVDERKIPTNRLAARLGLADYYGRHASKCTALHPAEVFLPLSQHIGKPSEPVKQAGDPVREGELVARAAGNISANLHASVSGTVTEVTAAGIRIRSDGGGADTDSGAYARAAQRGGV